MGCKFLGGKQLFFLMDALYAGPEAVYRPTKWKIKPFDGDWTSSIFLSQDPVAIESVGYDFLRSEYTSQTPYTWVQAEGADDYLHQAADKANWPEGVVYDPENDGTPISSLGAHEHWNGAEKKEYSRNLGSGNGIELVRIDKTTRVEDRSLAGRPVGFSLYANYPNPFNASTVIRYDLTEACRVELTVFNVSGIRIAHWTAEKQDPGVHSVFWNGCSDDGTPVPSGAYLCSAKISGRDGIQSVGIRMLLLK